MTDTTATATEPDEADALIPVPPEVRIGRAMTSMPFGVSYHATVTLESVAEYLEALRPVLERAADDHRADVLELRELRQQRDAVRAFLGTS